MKNKQLSYFLIFFMSSVASLEGKARSVEDLVAEINKISATIDESSKKATVEQKETDNLLVKLSHQEENTAYIFKSIGEFVRNLKLEMDSLTQMVHDRIESLKPDESDSESDEE